MNKEEIINILINILREHGKSLGDEETDVTLHTRPIGGIVGFDSLAGVTVTVECLERLNRHSDKIISLFVGDDSRGIPRALTVEEAADQIINMSHPK